MGFPSWTLWGMGIAAGAALLFILLAYFAQSPRQLARYRRIGSRLIGRGRALTGYGLASLLVAFGFFLVGIPIEGPEVVASPEPVAVAPVNNEDGPDLETEIVDFSTTEPIVDEETAAEDDIRLETPESGAFARPPTATPETDENSLDPEEDSGSSEDESTTPLGSNDETATPAPTDEPTNTPSPSATPTASPTATSTATPTITPTPTLTATPILGETAVVDTISSTLWVRRTPAGPQLELILNGDTVILESGRVSSGGVAWQQVRTVNGNLGWVQSEFLTFSERSEE